jgi:DMSO reductase anchor subunit
VLKRRYWRDIDRAPLPATRGSALGLPPDRTATVFEKPHTEANYLTKEMGFVLARRHATKLRRIALALFGAVPAAACGLVLLWPPAAAPALAVAAVSALVGALVERWLFFAEAKHVVTLYY